MGYWIRHLQLQHPMSQIKNLTKMKYKNISFLFILLLFKTNTLLAQGFLPSKIIIGEVKTQRGIYTGYEMLLSQINRELPYHLILEKSTSYCYFINLYISGKDTSAISNINITNPSEKKFYQHLYKLNSERFPKNRIIVKGIDLEYTNSYKNCLNAVYYMISKVSNDSLQTEADSIYFNDYKPNHSKAKALIRLIDSTRLSYLMTDDSVLQKIKTNLYISTNLGQAYTKSWSKQREKELLHIFNKTTFGLDRYCFIVDIFHLPNRRFEKTFLEKAPLKEFDIRCYYPIYVNRFASNKFRKTFKCYHHKNPFRRNKGLGYSFKQKQGAWLLNTKKYNYYILSN